jgi:putative ATPase
MSAAQDARDLYGSSTLLFLDEIHRFTKAQQDALLPGVENGWVTLIAAPTENPSFSVISPLLSRSLLLRLELLTDEELTSVVQTALAAPHGLAGNFRVVADAMTARVRFSSGDARRALTALDAAAAVALSRLAEASPPVEILGEDISRAVDRALLRYDRDGDEHYDVISAFIKSIRGSDPDAALHYLARMIEAGEDPRFIARRLIISAAEDIGLAQPQALPLAVAAADAVALIGMPEGRIPLAEATVYLATSPKSNAAYRGINEALTDVREGKSGVVPPHLRDASYAGAKSLGHGAGYVYPHNDPLGIVRQQYLPDSLAGRVYYNPTTHGQERDIAERLDRLRTILRGE